MGTQDDVQRWSGLMGDIISGMADWRQQHPKATFREIEGELDARLAQARARMLEDLAQASTAADWGAASGPEGPACPECGTRLKAEGGKKKRRLQTQGGQELVLERRYGGCPRCGSGVFPPG